jgi:hypothetical protein
VLNVKSASTVAPTNNLDGSGHIDSRATCPAGKRVISGGFNLGTTWSRYLTVISSYPNPTDESWYVQLRNNTSLALGTVEVTAFAVCVTK